MSRWHGRRGALAAGVVAVAATTTVALATPPAAQQQQFSTSSLPPAPGVGLTTNDDVEPALAVDGAGTVWVAGNIQPRKVNAAGPDPRDGHLLTGADVWMSTDNGRHYTWVADPFAAMADGPGTAGGADVDLAAASVRNSSGHYNLYLVGVWIASTAVAYSQDGGKTWTVQQLAGHVLGEDRPWVTPLGDCGFLLTYRAPSSYSDAFAEHYDVCSGTQTVPPTAVVSPANSTDGTLAAVVANSQRVGKPAVDASHGRYDGSVYVPMLDCYGPQPTDAVASGASSANCAGPSEVIVATSRDEGASFSVVHGPQIADKHVNFGEVNAAVDGAGVVYVTYSDDQHVFLVSSRDGGAHWSAPGRPLDVAVPGAAVFPTPVAGAPGHVVVAWYATNRSGDANDGTVMGASGDAAHSAPWRLAVAETTDAGRTWSRTTLPSVVHYGLVCTLGGLCSSSNDDRALYEAFGIGLTGAAERPVIAFMDDQPGGAITQTHVDVASAVPPKRPGRRRG